ncbi:MAG: Rv3235 family protein [Microbacteriaceae bacterium]|nr:Rv3235 family protein [Microbacteriaceae bacterium]MCL2794598.1 Rv3235 family protein [Microbacteriaceae bacterium]
MAKAQRNERFDADDFFGVQRTTELPDPTPLITNLVRCVVEILAGARDLEQISRWVTDDVFHRLSRRVSFASRARTLKGAPAQRPRFSIMSIRTSEPAAGVVEATVIVQMPQRVRAIALRLEGLDRRWRATSISVL